MASDVPHVRVLVLVVVLVASVKPVTEAVMVTALYALVMQMVVDDVAPWIVVAGGCTRNARVGFGE
jgi:hypothetical protein